MNFPTIDRSFFAGECFDAYRVLGAHPCRDDFGQEGWRFAVWAPGAVAVEICGGFDGWGPGVPMQKADTGVWSGFVLGLAEGELYKYRIHGKDGSTVMRADPYAFSTELRPGTASRLARMDFAFDDSSWMERRDKCRNLPLNIYELHAGSWKQKPNATKPDGSDGWYDYEELARELCDLNRERQSVEQDIFRRAIEQMEDLPESERSALVLSSEDWHQGVVGIVASRLSEKFSCPSFMIHLSGGSGKGSCRSYGGFNLFNALEACSDLLVSFGGHELAAGFTIEERNIPAFRTRMNQYVRAHTGEHPPVSMLDVDVDLQHPSLITLEEVEALSLLEPYGAGNNRPVFCLRGATLESVQGVGQNRHLKLRLQKSRVNFDGIFFSVTAEECGVCTGMRVDAAFYLQVNEFRSQRSIQLQLIDLRPSLDPSGRENEALSLCRELISGGTLSPRDAARALPSRDQFVRAWRILEREVGNGGVCEPMLPLLRRLSAEMVGAETFLRTAMCLQVFAERGLLSIEREGDALALRLTADGKKVELDKSPYLSALHGFLS